MRAQHDYSTSFVIVSRLPRKIYIYRWYDTALILQLTSKFYLEQIAPPQIVVQIVNNFLTLLSSVFDGWMDLPLSIRFSIRSHRSFLNTLYKRKRIYRHDESDRQLVHLYIVTRLGNLHE